MSISTLRIKAPGRELSRDDIASLEARWIDRPMAKAAQLRRLDAAQGRDMLGRDFKGDHSGIYIPYLRPGDGATVGYRVRRDSPEMERSSITQELKPKGKYLAPPEQRNMLYFPPGTSPEQLADGNLTVLLTEGEFKVLAAARLALHNCETLRFLACGVAGVWSWKGTLGKTTGINGERVTEKGPIRDLDLIAWKGRRVVIAFDADAKHKESVQVARRELIKELQRRGASVGCLEWDDRVYKQKGLDDFLAAAGPETVLKHLAAVEYRKRNVLDGSLFRLTPAGVMFLDPDNDRSPVRICGPLEVVARTRNADSENWGVLLRWTDADDIRHLLPIPQSSLVAEGLEVRQTLAAGGLWLGSSSKARQLLIQYLQAEQTESRVTCVDRIGWHGDTFVLPRLSIGPLRDEMVLQNLGTGESLIKTAGTLEEWQTEVAAICESNSRLMMALCMGLASPCLNLVGEESGGVHLVGNSSTGKSTALMVAGSFLGGGGRSGFTQSWRNTSNGLEAVAEAHNDLLLCLDELAQIDARDAAETAYLLGNGSGKGRMSKSITVRRKLTWNLLFLSAGEVTLADHAASVGRMVKGGVDVRLLNVPADAGAGMGIFEDIHGSADSAAAVRLLRDNCRRLYGTGLIAWLEYLTANRDDIEATLKKLRAGWVKQYLPAGATGEVVRASERFSLLAAAGELGILGGVLPWRHGSAAIGVAACFQAWLRMRGSVVASSDDQSIAKVRRFIEQHGASRFQKSASQQIPNRAGFVRDGEDGLEYMILSEVFRSEVCAGFEVDKVCSLLDSRGHLGKHEKDRWSDKPRIAAAGGTVRVYIVKASILE